MRSRTFPAIAGLIGAAFVAAAYGTDVGRGFVKDDAAWVATGIEAIRHPASALAVESSGYFFRPLVTLSFAADYAVYGTHALGYGITNVLLLAACAAALGIVLAEFGLDAAAIATALLAWLLNPHGISMALLWISGRTSLLMMLCSALAITAVMRRHGCAAAILIFAALLAKEDAIAVPLIALACAWAARPLSRREAAGAAAWMAAAIGGYFILRLRTSAMTPATAPPYYRLLTDPASIAVNAMSYLDRGATSCVVIALLALGVYGLPRALRLRPADRTARLLMAGAVWFAGGFAITVLIPVRSDLYAVFPSGGAALACAAIVDACRRRTNAAAMAGRDRALAALLAIVAIALVPVYRARNARFAGPARVSALVQRQLASDAGQLPSSGTIVFEDTPARFLTFQDAFDGMASDAVRLFTGRSVTASIVTPPDTGPQPGEVARYVLRNGRVERVR